MNAKIQLPIVSEWSKAEIEGSVIARFERVAAAFPDRLALRYGTARFTYDELNQAANRLAHAILQRLGPGEEGVAMLLEQSHAPVLAILGILKAGKFYVPLNPAAPPAVLSAIWRDSGARLLLTNPLNRPAAEGVVPDAAQLLDIESLDSSLSEENPGLEIGPDRLFSVVYTSGSTGQPKGVMQDHRNILHAVWANQHRHHYTVNDRFVLLTSTSFGASVSNLMGALLCGAALLPYNLPRQGLSNLASWLAEERITVYHSVPTVFKQLVMSLKEGQILQDLRVIKLGGEPVARRLVELYQSHFSEKCVLQVSLGSTESHVVALYMLAKDSQFSDPVVPAGFPELDKEILLLDTDGNPVAEGEVGEIVLKTRYVSPGYWRQPEVNAACYLPSGDPGLRIFRTGDLGRLRPDGCLEHLGRKDAQVKIRGNRVDVTAVENALLELPAVREAAVVAQPVAAGENRLVAYVVPAGENFPGPGALRSLLAGILPEYMIPSAFVELEKLPLLPFGKVNYRALPPVAWDRPPVETSYVAPRTPLEERLVEAWAKVLPYERIGVEDDYFALGGDSLSAAQLTLHIREMLGVEINQLDLFESPTVSSLARFIERLQGSRPDETENGAALALSAEELQRALRRLGMG